MYYVHAKNQIGKRRKSMDNTFHHTSCWDNKDHSWKWHRLYDEYHRYKTCIIYKHPGCRVFGCSLMNSDAWYRCFEVLRCGHDAETWAFMHTGFRSISRGFSQVWGPILLSATVCCFLIEKQLSAKTPCEHMEILLMLIINNWEFVTIFPLKKHQLSSNTCLYILM